MDKVLSDMKLSVNKKENNFITNIYKKVKKPPRADQAHIQIEDPGMIYQADLLYLPNDDGYKYLLVVVDLNNNACDAEPLKKRSAEDIRNAFITIFKRKYIKVPKFSLQTDDGSEFKNVVQKFFNEKGVFIRRGVPGRHKQQSIVENYNKIIGTILHKKMLIDEHTTGVTNRVWVSEIPTLIKSLNKHLKKDNLRTIKEYEPTHDVDVLEIGSKVRVALNEPIDITNGKRLHGTFRASDPRWNPKIYTIEDVYLVPNQPALYIVSGHNKNLFQRYELQLVDKPEVMPQQRSYVINKLLNHYIKNKKIYYKVLWDDGSTTEEPRDMLYKDVPQLIDDFEEEEKKYKKGAIDGKKIRVKKTGSGSIANITMNRDDYLEAARKTAKENDYDPSLLEHATDGVHKLVYDGVPFGRKGYKDRIQYEFLEKNKKVPEGTTEKKYKNYRKRAKAVMLITGSKTSPASLAYYILW